MRRYLDKESRGRWIKRRSPIEWPARPLDIKPLDVLNLRYTLQLTFLNNELLNNVGQFSGTHLKDDDKSLSMG